MTKKITLLLFEEPINKITENKPLQQLPSLCQQQQQQQQQRFIFTKICVKGVTELPYFLTTNLRY